MNLENFKRLLDQIERDPEHWDQSTWHSGDRHCLLGWAQIMSGKQASSATALRDAAEWLEVHNSQAIRLIAVKTLDEVRSIYEHGDIPSFVNLNSAPSLPERQEERHSESVFFCFNAGVTLRVTSRVQPLGPDLDRIWSGVRIGPEGIAFGLTEPRDEWSEKRDHGRCDCYRDELPVCRVN